MLRHMVTYFSAYLGNKKGQAMVEYGVIIALIAVVVIATVALIGTSLNEKFVEIKDALL